jgi:excisionase family DNA binding protein
MKHLAVDWELHTVNQLPELVTPKQAAAFMGLSDFQIRNLIRDGRLAHVNIGRRVMIPRLAIPQFIAENTVQPCHAETRVRAFATSTNAVATTSSGQSAAAAGSAQRALAIASKLKSPSQNSSTPAIAEQAHVIPSKSS